MRHRLYYLLPDIESARHTLDDLLLSRIEVRHVRFMTRSAPLPPDLPEANVFQKTDLIHGAESGMVVGAFLGMAIGVVIVMYLDLTSRAEIVIVTTLFGILFGGWAASLVAAALPNSRLQSFYPELDAGKILMIVDVPAQRVAQIEKVLAARHPEMRFSGEEPTIPVFP